MKVKKPMGRGYTLIQNFIEQKKGGGSVVPGTTVFVDSYASLPPVGVVDVLYIVKSDETHGGISTEYYRDGAMYVFIGDAGLELDLIWNSDVVFSDFYANNNISTLMNNTRVLLEPGNNTFNIDAGAYDNLNKLRFEGTVTPTMTPQTIVYIDDGVTMTSHPNLLKNVNLFNLSAGSEPIMYTLSSQSAEVIYIGENCDIHTVSPSGTRYFRGSKNSALDIIINNKKGGGLFGNGDGTSTFELLSGSPFPPTQGAILNIYLFDYSYLENDFIEGLLSARVPAIFLYYDATSRNQNNLAFTQTNFGGNFILTPVDVAFRMFYDDSNTSFGVQNVQEAIEAMNNSLSGYVQSVTGPYIDNTDPQNPVDTLDLGTGAAGNLPQYNATDRGYYGQVNPGMGTNNCIAIDAVTDELYMAFADSGYGGKLSVKQYNTSTKVREYLGTPGFSSSTVGQISMYVNGGVVRVAVADDGNFTGKAALYSDGGTGTRAVKNGGNALSSGQTTHISMKGIGGLSTYIYIAFDDAGTYTGVCVKYDTMTDTATVLESGGIGMNMVLTNEVSIDVVPPMFFGPDTVYVAYTDASTNRPYVSTCNASVGARSDISGPISANSCSSISFLMGGNVNPKNTPVIGFRDSVAGTLIKYYDGMAWNDYTLLPAMTSASKINLNNPLAGTLLTVVCENHMFGMTSIYAYEMPFGLLGAPFVQIGSLPVGQFLFGGIGNVQVSSSTGFRYVGLNNGPSVDVRAFTNTNFFVDSGIPAGHVYPQSGHGDPTVPPTVGSRYLGDEYYDIDADKRWKDNNGTRKEIVQAI